jgi:hypothetical protein
MMPHLTENNMELLTAGTNLSLLAIAVGLLLAAPTIIDLIRCLVKPCSEKHGE